jgi:purine nucleosidase
MVMTTPPEDETRTGQSRTRLVIDTDAGVDDAVALLYALARPEVDVLAVTCVVGNVDVERAARTIRALLDLAGAKDTPVATGTAQPLRGARALNRWYGDHGTGYAKLPDSTATVDPHGVETIVRLARNYPGELNLLALGPLTNVAAAVLVEPELPRLLRSAVVMGGAYTVPGNEGARSEFNIDVDPEAARIVLQAWENADGATPLTLVGLDVTQQASLSTSDVAALLRAAGVEYSDDDAATLSGEVAHPLCQFLLDGLRHACESAERTGGEYAAVLHDALAAVALVEPQVISTRATTVDVEIAGTLTRGETVADWFGTWGRRPNAEVALGCDVDRFRDLLTTSLAKLLSTATT